MVDSRQKGTRGENKAKDLLRSLTGHPWERTPSSGALDKKHGLKGDLYIPNANNVFCVEVKFYEDCHIDHSLISSANPTLLGWWNQTTREAREVQRLPLLIFMWNRSKLYVATNEEITTYPKPYLVYMGEAEIFNILELEPWIKYEKPKFIK